MPIQKNTLTISIEEAQKKLKKISQMLTNFNFPESPFIETKFIANELNKERIDEIANIFPVGENNDEYIYLIKVHGENKNVSGFRKAFKKEKDYQNSDEFKNKKGKKDLSRYNSIDCKQYLYVGRSQKLRSRIRQHLGENYKGTYALHLSRWSKELNETVEIVCYKFESTDNLLIQSIEDALWDKLKPAFGRKGDK